MNNRIAELETLLGNVATAQTALTTAMPTQAELIIALIDAKIALAQALGHDSDGPQAGAIGL